MNCPNCKASVGCSCKLRKASDGRQVCINCSSNYETFLKNNSRSVPTSKDFLNALNTEIKKNTP